MNNFTFWKNIKSSSIDEARAQSALGESDTHQRINLGSDCGLVISSKAATESPILINSDTHVFFSPSSDLVYKNSVGMNASQQIQDDIRLHGSISIEHFQNAFSFVFYDKRSEAVLIAIDHFGINRMFYTNEGSQFIASSALDGILSISKHVPCLSNQAIYNYIDSHVIPSPHTIFEDIHKLEPSQKVEYINGNITSNIYWMPEFHEHSDQSAESLEKQTLSYLEESVSSLHLPSTSGAFLSGGLDSSTVSGYFAKCSDKPVSSYTMGFEEAGYDETEFAEIAAKHFDINLRHYYVKPDDVAESFTQVITGFDEPFGNSSAIPAYLCANFAGNDGVTTMLAGDGGDEIFAGNYRYAKQHKIQFYHKLPAALRRYLFEPFFLNNHFHTQIKPISKLKSYIQQATTPMPDRMERYNFINQFGADSIFNKDFLNQVNVNSPLMQKQIIYNRPGEASMLNRMLYMDWKFTLADNDLVKVNTTCKLAGINVKYPMLDDQLVYHSTRIPSKLKMKSGVELRSFYKNAVRNFLPHKILYKEKHGFGLPFGEWLKKSATLQNHIYDNLFALKKRNYIDPAFIEKIIKTHSTESAAGYYGNMVWILAVLEEWLSSRNL